MHTALLPTFGSDTRGAAIQARPSQPGRSRGRRAPRWLTLLALLCAFPPAWAGSSILIWPIDPVIEGDQQATAIRLENRGESPAVLQLRVLAWRQSDGREAYLPQEAIVGTPPLIRIAPGDRQLVRLTRVVPEAAGRETAYRVLIDELPTPEDGSAGDGRDANAGRPAPSGAAAIKFQIRYSLPLFSYGAGLSAKPDPGPKRDPRRQGAPRLSWAVAQDADGKTWLEIDNHGDIHARLRQVSLVSGEAAPLVVGEGLLGYVLPASRMRWPLPHAPAAGARLQAIVNAADAAEFIAGRLADQDR